MPSRVFETEQYQADLARLGPAVQKRLERKLRAHVYPYLSASPRFGPNIKRLTGFEPPTWRYRVGEWRFFYASDESRRVVSMLAADHRSRAYR